MFSDVSFARDVLLPVIGTFIMGLLIINGYFISRLVQKIDKVDLMPALKEAIDTIWKQISKFEDELRRIRNDYQQIAELKTRLSVIERLIEHYFERKDRYGQNLKNSDTPEE